MAQVVITLRVMPEGTETDLADIERQAKSFIEAFGGSVGRVEIKPVGFGIKALEIIFIMDEKKGSTDRLEEDISGIIGVMSVEVTDVRRAIG